MSAQISLLTSHKGVDLHAATALRVMQRHLEGGDALVALQRAEVHTFWAGPGAPDVARLLEIGRLYNPNKHHYAVFQLTDGGEPWFGDSVVAGSALAAGWPGEATACSLAPVPAQAYTWLLGGEVAPELAAVDVVSFPLGETGPLLSGVVWRLVLRDDGRAPRRLAERLAITRAGEQGLLVNPHQQGWFVSAPLRAAARR